MSLPDAGAMAVSKAAEALRPAEHILLLYHIAKTLLSKSLGRATLVCPDLQTHILESATLYDTRELALQPVLGVGGVQLEGKDYTLWTTLL